MERYVISATKKDLELYKELKWKSIKSTFDPSKLNRVLVVKPWGYEHMVCEADNKEGDVWFSQINAGETTSMHCHPSKVSIITVIEGELYINTIQGKPFVLAEGETVVFQPKVFHGETAISRDTRMIQMEMPANKLDALRYSDKRGRENKEYNKGCAMVWY